MLRILPRHQVKQAVGTLPDVPDLLPPRVPHQLALNLPSATDPNPLDHPALHPGYEQVSFPCWKAVPGIKKNVGDPNRRHPEKARWLHAFPKRLLADHLTRVF